MNIAELTQFFGWASVISIAVLCVVFMMLTVFKQGILQIHSQLFDLNEEDLNLIYLKYFAQYKLLMFILFIVPYLALKAMTS